MFFLRIENSRFPSRDHDSGTCSSSCAAFVNRTATPVAGDCHQIPGSPSRADWNVTRRLSDDHTGKRLLPSYVKRWLSNFPDRSYVKMSDIAPSVRLIA